MAGNFLSESLKSIEKVDLELDLSSGGHFGKKKAESYESNQTSAITIASRQPVVGPHHFVQQVKEPTIILSQTIYRMPHQVVQSSLAPAVIQNIRMMRHIAQQQNISMVPHHIAQQQNILLDPLAEELRKKKLMQAVSRLHAKIRLENKRKVKAMSEKITDSLGIQSHIIRKRCSKAFRQYLFVLKPESEPVWSATYQIAGSGGKARFFREREEVLLEGTIAVTRSTSAGVSMKSDQGSSSSDEMKLLNGVCALEKQFIERELKYIPIVYTIPYAASVQKITGLLGQCGSQLGEERIICLCHGKIFNALEFVRHAGGGNVSNPCQYIAVYPSPTILMS